MKGTVLLSVALLLVALPLIFASSKNTCGTVLAPCSTNPKGAYMACIDQDFITQVAAFLPEKKRVADSLISPNDWNANVFYNFTDLAKQNNLKTSDFKAYINITILWEGAGYRNQFGYFLFDYKDNTPTVRKDKDGNLMQYKLFNDVTFPSSSSGDKGACLQSGVSVDIGPFVHLDNVGFVNWPDGYNTKSHPNLYSANKLNPGKEVQVFMFSVQNQYIIGLEDVNPLSSSDRDYNDIVFQFQTGVGATVNVPVLDTCPDPTCGGTGHGVCNSTSKTCTCLSSASVTYYGDSCQNSYTCDCEQGTCIGNGQCVCASKYAADCKSCASGLVKYPECKDCSAYCDKGYTCDSFGNCIAPPPPPAPTPFCLTQPFGVASDYLVFVRGDFVGANSDVQGRIAAGGNIQLSQYSLAEALNPNDDDSLGCSDITPPWAAVAVGSFTFSSGNARIGGLGVGDQNKIDASVSSGLAPGCSVVQTTSAVDVETTFDYLFGISKAFAGLSANGDTFLKKDSSTSLYFSAPDKQPNDFNYVFELDANDLTTANAVVFNNFQGAQIKAIIINIDASKYTFKDTSFSSVLQGASGYLGSKIIWNFYNAGSITIDSIGIPGIILAPKANIKGNNGVVWGSIYANSFSGDLQVNYPVGSEALCIMSNFKFTIGDAPCPPCDSGAAPGKGCRCECDVGCPDGKFADPYGSCQCICPINNDCALGQDSATCLCLGANVPVQDGTCSGVYDGVAWPAWLTDFQIVTSGDLTLKATRVGGRIAAGGTTTLKRIAVGDSLTPNKKTFDCATTNGQAVPAVILANGPITFKSGSVAGNILFGDYTQLAPYIALPTYVRAQVLGCNIPSAAPDNLKTIWNFDAAFTALQSYSNSLADAKSTPATGQSYFAYDVLTLWGYNRGVETFRISSDDLSKARRVDINNVRADATIIIDVTGNDDVSIKDVGLASLIPFAPSLLWNAASAKTITIKNVALPGLILAPKASILNPVGRIIGGAFVKTFSATGNVALEWPFTNWAGCLPEADLLSASCGDCAAGFRRSSVTSCDCEAVVTISQNSVSIFEGNNGALVTFGIQTVGTRAPSSVTVNFPNDGTCKLQLDKNGNPNVFSLVQSGKGSVSKGYTFTTPTWSGFSAQSFSFVTVFESDGLDTCTTVPTPNIVSVSYDPIH